MRGDGPGTVVSAVKGVFNAHAVLLRPRPVSPGPTPGADAHIPAHTHTCGCMADVAGYNELRGIQCAM